MSLPNNGKSFKPAWWLDNQHLQTLFPSLFRKVKTHSKVWRERLITPDNDYLDVDFCGKGTQPLVFLLHGLAGSSQSGYIKGLQLSLFSAVAVSVPFVLSRCATKLDSGFSKICRENLIQIGALAEAEKISSLGNLTDIKSFWQYDDQVVARLHGFLDAEDFYQRSSSKQFLNQIHITTLIIHSEDDPFMTADVIPGPNEISFKVKIEFTKGGGHVGFVAGWNPFKPQYG